MELNILNSLIGSNDIENDFEKIATRYPETLSCEPLLVAVRENEIYAIETNFYGGSGSKLNETARSYNMKI